MKRSDKNMRSIKKPVDFETEMCCLANAYKCAGLIFRQSQPKVLKNQ